MTHRRRGVGAAAVRTGIAAVEVVLTTEVDSHVGSTVRFSDAGGDS